MEEEQTITFSLPSTMIREIDLLVKEGRTTRDEILRSALNQYFRSQEVWKQIFERGEEWAKELGVKNEGDVDRLIHEFRKEQATAKGGL
jgi:Arc/MetJ-type ribon-helix-helix transcriptional regulator